MNESKGKGLTENAIMHGLVKELSLTVCVHSSRWGLAYASLGVV
jgi:hypothetical protein